MSRYRFAKEVGVTPSYVTRLCKDDPPWPSRELARKIGVVTSGYVTPNDLAGYGNGHDQAPSYHLYETRRGRPRRGQAFDFDL